MKTGSFVGSVLLLSLAVPAVYAQGSPGFLSTSTPGFPDPGASSVPGYVPPSSYAPAGVPGYAPPMGNDASSVPGYAPPSAVQPAPGLAGIPSSMPIAGMPMVPMGGQPGAFSNSAHLGYSNPFGMMPKFSPDYFKAISSSRLMAGTILTGILEDDLSSNSSKSGDLFTIRLQDGFVKDGVEMIPKQSKIVGSVVSAVSAAGRKGGMPGSVDISLQTLVFPDGRSVPFNGYLEHNPSADMKNKPGQAPIDYANTAKRSVNSLVTMVTGRFGMPIRMSMMGGAEFKLEKGEAVPIKVGRPIDLSRVMGTAQSIQQPNTPYTVTPGAAPMGAPMPQGLSAPPPLSLTDPAASAPMPGAPPVAPQIGSSGMSLDGPDPF